MGSTRYTAANDSIANRTLNVSRKSETAFELNEIPFTINSKIYQYFLDPEKPLVVLRIKSGKKGIHL